MLLVVWAASFGIDERGLPRDPEDDLDLVTPPLGMSPPPTPLRKTARSVSDEADDERVGSREFLAERGRRDRREHTEEMVREVLQLIDNHGIMRKPTWDGVRVLLLILPLMEGTDFIILIEKITP